MEYKTTTELGFTFPVESSLVTKKRMEHFRINQNEVYSALSYIEKYYPDGELIRMNMFILHRFVASEISFYDTTFLNIDGRKNSICAVAVPFENKFKRVLKLINKTKEELYELK